jgi:protocatechuate 3,4-dioxygenase beta subunit
MDACGWVSERGPRFLQGAKGVCLMLLLVVPGAFVAASAEPPEPAVPRLEFRVLDVDPGGGPVAMFRYSYEFFSAAQDEPSLQRDRPYQSADGILKISESVPPFGRVRVWIEADDPQKGYRHGYASFSYRLDADKPSQPAPIRLERGIVVTGKVLDADTGKPVAGAEVAPMKSGHHFDWADWDEAVKTDGEGKYRIATQEAQGIAARHPQYRDEEPMRSIWEFGPGQNQVRIPTWIFEPDKYAKDRPAIGPDGLVIRLHPLMALRGRAVDPQGKPVAGVSCDGSGEAESDAEGRFSVKVTKQDRSGRGNVHPHARAGSENAARRPHESRSGRLHHVRVRVAQQALGAIDRDWQQRHLARADRSARSGRLAGPGDGCGLLADGRAAAFR